MKYKLGLLLALFISFWAVKPIIFNGLFTIHDDTQVARVIEMGRSLQEGNFPVRWSNDLGYGFGYPIFNYYAPLPYYFGGVFFNIFNNPVVATQIMYIFGIITAGLLMYIFAYEIGGLFPALLASALYVYAPYHAVQVYVRGSVGEYWAFAFIPGILYSLYKLAQKNNIKWIFITSFFISSVILSHNILSLFFIIYSTIFSIILIIYSITQKNNTAYFYNFLLSLIFSLILTSFFWLPAIFESSFTNVDSITLAGSGYHNHFVYLDQLWDSPWGFAGSAVGRTDGMSFKIGKIHLILGLIGFAFYLFSYKKIKLENKYIINYLIILFGISFLLILPQSVKIWELFNLYFKYVQYPWRFINFLIPFLAIIAIFPFYVFKKMWINFLIIVLIFFTIFINAKYFQGQKYLSINKDEYLSSEYLNTTASSISDEYLPKEFVKNEETLAEHNQIIDYPHTDYLNKSAFKWFKADLPDENIKANISYFPAWSVYVDGQRIKPFNNEGKISFTVNSGIHDILLIFINTQIEIIGNTISIIGVLVILHFIYKDKLEKPLFNYGKNNS